MNLQEKKQKIFDVARNYLDTNRKEVLSNIIEQLESIYSSKLNKINSNYIDEAFDLIEIISINMGLGFSAMLSILYFRAINENILTEEQAGKYIPKEHKEQVFSIIKSLKILQKFDNESVFGKKEQDYLQKEAGMSKRSKKFSKTYEQYLTQQGDLFRQFLMSASQDVRVVFIKLAYQYYKILNIDLYNENKKYIICNEARYVFAPIAHQLGLYKIKTNMEETAMRILNSDTYQYIESVLAASKQEREKYISDFIEPIKKSLQELNIEADVIGRPKSIHSIWKKILKQKVSIDKIYDLFAIRIILTNKFENLKQEKDMCWLVYSKITDVWRPNPNRLKDWVSAPKASGYESLHTTVIGPEGKWVEVQIRTQRMDEIAEKGDAAHWKYKEIRGQSEHQNWLSTIRQLLENPQELDEEDFVKKELYSDTIFVYTPKGELIKLKAKATVLDFAYRLHTEIGYKCSGAKIGNKLVGIRHLLKNGDIVDVTTSKNQIPRQEWLEIAVTTHARNRIKRALKQIEDENIELGKKIMVELFEKMKTKYKKSDFELDNKIINQLRKKLNFDKINNFYLALANNTIKIDDNFLFKQFVEPQETTYENIIKKLTEQIVNQQQSDKNLKSDVLEIDNSVSSIKFELAKCCNPIMGDKIFAYISATSGTKIHKIDCPNAVDLITKHPYRILPARWKQNDSKQRFKAKIFIICQQTPGIIAKISEEISNAYAIDLYEINIKPTQNKTYEGTIGVLVASVDFLNKLIDKLVKINGVLNIKRQEKI